MLRILFLDDDKGRYDEFSRRVGNNAHIDLVSNSCDFWDNLCAVGHLYDVICLDHDLQDFLQGNEFTGKDACNMIINRKDYLKNDLKIIIHSANPIGVANMLAVLKWLDDVEVYVIHWAWTKVSYNNGLVFSV